ncbi:MAG: hypothetical protein NZ481_08000 [Candidatus Kapabacteria bacterium]|nr:hypothetical protein [Candidatus Kapabacteria bacterium]
MRWMLCNLLVGVAGASLVHAQTVERQVVSGGAVHARGGGIVLEAGNQQVLQLNPAGTKAPAWSIQRDTRGDRRGHYAVDLQAARDIATQVASGDYSVIGGGKGNTASGEASTVGGGSNNTASGDYSTVGGGFGNTTGGNYSVVIGGRYNEANADFVMVFGDNVEPSVAEAYRVYFFGDGSIDNRDRARPSGFLVINRLNGNHPIHVGTNKANGNGAYLSAGGVWTNASSRSKKDRFVPLNAQEVLAKIRQLPVEGWYYAGTNEYHIGPCAEDFHEAFGTGVLDSPDARTSLAASDVAGVALLGIKALVEQVEQEGAAVRSAQEELEALRQESAALREKVTVLEQKNQALERKSRALERENWELRQKGQELEQKNRALEQRLAAVEQLVQELLSRTTSRERQLGENLPLGEGATTILHDVAVDASTAGLQVREMQGSST